MNTFEFNILEYFKLQDGKFFGLVGVMRPDTFPLITKDYNVKLITSSGKEYVFKDIGEEIFVSRGPKRDNKRALRTTDDVEKYLKNLAADPVKIVGCKWKNSM